MAGLVFKWLKRQGGVAGIQAANAAKAQALYSYLDSSQLYANTVHAAARSRMNVPFFLADESLNAAFLSEAEAAGLMQLKGHKRSEEHTSELQSLMRISYAVFCLKKKKSKQQNK